MSFEFPWERGLIGQIRNGADPEMPDGLTLADQHAFLCMSKVYIMYALKQISKDTAADMKSKVRRSYQAEQSASEYADKMARHYAILMRDTEAAATACRKDPTPENAIRLCDVLVGLEKGGDQSETDEHLLRLQERTRRMSMDGDQ